MLETLTIILPILISIAYLTLLERKILAAIQRRKGPNLIGIFGLLQPLADGLKLLLKELIKPEKANIILFLIAPIITLLISLLSWIVMPINLISKSELELTILFNLAMSSIAVYGIIISGWASNSKYALLGAIRSTAQMISYEISIGLIILSSLILSSSLNYYKLEINQENIWLLIVLLPSAIMFLISAIAETNRPPFDLPEAEAELVAGYNVEYSAIGFAMFFLGEYLNIILMSVLFSELFLGGANSLKLIAIISLFIWIRASFPRYRYDQLMYLGWKVFLPISLTNLILIISIC